MSQYIVKTNFEGMKLGYISENASIDTGWASGHTDYTSDIRLARVYNSREAAANDAKYYAKDFNIIDISE